MNTSRRFGVGGLQISPCEEMVVGGKELKGERGSFLEGRRQDGGGMRKGGMDRSDMNICQEPSIVPLPFLLPYTSVLQDG